MGGSCLPMSFWIGSVGGQAINRQQGCEASPVRKSAGGLVQQEADFNMGLTLNTGHVPCCLCLCPREDQDKHSLTVFV